MHENVGIFTAKTRQVILQAATAVHGVLSYADRHRVGAEIALEANGCSVADLYPTVGGAAAITIAAIRGGRRDETLTHFPKIVGSLAMIDRVDLDANPDFMDEWEP